jgi:hypothetical protein
MPSLFEIKAAGRAKAKAAREALAKEEALAGGAGALWASAFDYVYDSAAADPAAAQAFASLPEDARILVVVPGFSSWSALTAQHVDAWVSSALTVNPASSSAPPAKTVAFKWDCGDVRWAGEDVWTEAAAAWQGAHESAAAAAQALATLCATLRAAPNRRVVVAAHSLGARVALGACVIDRGAQPLIDGLVLIGAAVDDCAIGSDADAEFQLTPLLANCSALTLVHSSRDPTLTKLWAAGEYTLYLALKSTPADPTPTYPYRR